MVGNALVATREIPKGYKIPYTGDIRKYRNKQEYLAGEAILDEKRNKEEAGCYILDVSNTVMGGSSCLRP